MQVHALPGLPGRERVDPRALRAVPDQNAPVARDVVDGQVARELEHAAQRSLQRDGVEPAGGTPAVGGEPDFAAVRGPGQVSVVTLFDGDGVTHSEGRVKGSERPAP